MISVETVTVLPCDAIGVGASVEMKVGTRVTKGATGFGVGEGVGGGVGGGVGSSVGSSVGGRHSLSQTSGQLSALSELSAHIMLGISATDAQS